MLNRETGVKPVLSRSCNAELVLKCHWETGKARRAMKQSQKNCLIIAHYDPAKDRMERYKSFLRFSVFMRRKAFFILLLNFSARETRTARQKI